MARTAPGRLYFPESTHLVEKDLVLFHVGGTERDAKMSLDAKNALFPWRPNDRSERVGASEVASFTHIASLL